MAVKISRQLPDLAYVANGVKLLDLPTEHSYEMLCLRLKGTLTITGGTGAGTLADEQPYTLIKRLELVADGSDVLKALDFTTLAFLNSMARGTPPDFTVVAAAAGEYNFVAEADLYLAIPDIGEPLSTLLDSALLTSLQLRVTWGTDTDLLSGSDGTLALTNVVLQVSTKEVLELGGRLTRNKESTIEKDVAATSAAFDIELPVGSIYRRVVVKALVADVRSAAVVNAVSLIADGTFRLRDTLNAVAVRQANKLAFGLETLPAGYYVLDFDAAGDLEEVIDSSHMGSLILRLDVTKGAGTHTIRLYPQELLLPVS